MMYRQLLRSILNRLEKYKYKYYLWRRKKMRAKARKRTGDVPYMAKFTTREQKKYEELGLKWWRLHRDKAKFEDGIFGYDVTDSEISMNDIREYMASKPGSPPNYLRAEYRWTIDPGEDPPGSLKYVGDTSTKFEYFYADVTSPHGDERYMFTVENGEFQPPKWLEDDQRRVAQEAFENWKATR